MATDAGLLIPSAYSSRVWPQLYGRYPSQVAQEKQDQGPEVIEVQARRVDLEDAAVRVSIGGTPPRAGSPAGPQVAGPVAPDTSAPVKPSEAYAYEVAGAQGEVKLRSGPMKRGMLIDVMA